MIRWKRILEHSSNPQYTKGRCGQAGERILNDVEAVEKINQWNDDLYVKLRSRQKAISNWKRLKIVIVILKMTGGRVDESEKSKHLIEEEEKQ